MLIWLASYPRSGNTWLRLMLHDILTGGQSRPGGRAAGNGFAPIVSSRSFIERQTDVQTSDLNDRELHACRRAAHDIAAGKAAAPFFVKVHDNHQPVGAGEDGLFSPAAGSLAIYLLRDPADVAVSLAGFAGIDLPRAVDILCDDHASRSHITRQPHHDQVAYHLGRWSNHVSGWLSRPSDQVLRIRYEDLHRDPAGQLRIVIGRLGLNVSQARIEAAVERTRFDHLSRQERRHGFNEAPAGRIFFRGGRIGDGRRLLSDADFARLVAANGAVMTAQGYAVRRPETRPETSR